MLTENKDQIESDRDRLVRLCGHLDALADIVNANARDHGFWDEPKPFGLDIALMHSELSEALEADRHGNPPDDHCPEFSGTEVELADVIIRVLDSARQRGFRIGAAVAAKHAFNAGRPHKHGKSY